jgi:SLT domain-containing protein
MSLTLFATGVEGHEGVKHPRAQKEITIMRKITLLIGGAVGYVLGTRAGRERYEQIVSQARGIWENPKVQEQATKAQDLAKKKGSEVQQKVSGSSDDSSSGTSTPSGTSTTSGTSTSGTSTSTGTSTVTGTSTAGDPLAVGDPLGRDEVGGFTDDKAPHTTSATSGTTGLA